VIAVSRRAHQKMLNHCSPSCTPEKAATFPSLSWVGAATASSTGNTMALKASTSWHRGCDLPPQRCSFRHVWPLYQRERSPHDRSEKLLDKTSEEHVASHQGREIALLAQPGWSATIFRPSADDVAWICCSHTTSSHGGSHTIQTPGSHLTFGRLWRPCRPLRPCFPRRVLDDGQGLPPNHCVDISFHLPSRPRCGRRSLQQP